VSRPYKVSASLTKEGGSLLDKLVEHLGANRSIVIEMAIRRLASGYSIKPSANGRKDAR